MATNNDDSQQAQQQQQQQQHQELAQRVAAADTGVIIIDHGSRREESNAMLNDVVALFRETNPQWRLVEPAHMEIAQPDLASAFRKLVALGVKLIVIHPFFLLPGRHWSADIPRLATEAAAACGGGVRFLVTAPLSAHPLIARIMQSRIETCLAAASDAGDACDVCVKEGRHKCAFAGGTSDIEDLSVIQ